MVSFADTAAVAPSVSRSLVHGAIAAIRKRQLVIADYRDVDMLGFERDLQTRFAQSQKLALVVSDNDIDDRHKSRTFCVWAIPLAWSSRV
jgi:hypothetical protein